MDAGRRARRAGRARHVPSRPSAAASRSSATDDGGYRVVGEGIERLLARHDLGNDEALAHVESRLRQIGVIRALQEQGFEAGDDVEIGGVAVRADVLDCRGWPAVIKLGSAIVATDDGELRAERARADLRRPSRGARRAATSS